MNPLPPQPTRPNHIPMYADVCLHALVERNLGDKISLGGAFGLLHYLDYRPTFDVDAWWTENASTRDKEQVVEAIMAALIVYGQVRRRAFGDVISIELETADSKKTFSFQIAERSAQLLPSMRYSTMSKWIDATLYPDVDPPDELVSLADRVDFIARLCAAWDFGLVPDKATLDEIRRPEWQAAVAACQLLTSHTYHLLRRWHHLEPAPYLGQKLGYIRDDPNLAYI